MKALPKRAPKPPPCPWAEPADNPLMTYDHGFSATGSVDLPALGTTAHRFLHSSGAVHIHLQNSDPHRCFAVGFRTSPEDSTGLPHILEHTALCGSQRFPVRDPFFMMMRRSLQTFMNAMTYPDRTVYPFATQNPKDFANLLNIYLDASFCPRLHPLDFAQEGWRLEPTTDSPPGWKIKGVVYNEMKGAMADTDSLVFDALGQVLLPNTCYRHNSGGTPSAIPSLEHQDLVAFHRRTYCAANACFTTWGDLNLDDLHRQFAAYCQRFPGAPVALPEVQPPCGPLADLTIPVPLAEDQDPRAVTATGCAWVWPEASPIDEVLLGELFDHLCFGHAAAPIRLALDRSGLARSCAGSGYLAYLRNGLFMIEAQGMDPERQDGLRPLVEATLQQLAVNGFAVEEISSALHQLELRRRTIGGDGMPFGLQLCLRATGAWCRGSDELSVLQQDPALERLRSQALTPGFWQTLIRTRLLENQHCVWFRTAANANYHAEVEQQEATLVQQRVAALDAAGVTHLQQQATALAERQGSIDDPSLLPDLAISDIPTQRQWADGPWESGGIRRFVAPTNGILHLSMAIPLGQLRPSDLGLLPMVTGAIGRLGFGDHDYQDTARLLDAVCGGVSAHIDCRSDANDPELVVGYLVCSIRGLASRHQDFVGLLPRILSGQRFDEIGRIGELLAEGLSGMQEQVLQAGHQLAALAAQRSFPGWAGLGHRMSGLGRLALLQRAHQCLEQEGPSSLSTEAEAGAALLQRLLTVPPAIAVIGDAAADDRILNAVRDAFAGLNPQGSAVADHCRFRPAAEPMPGHQAFTTATPVSFSAMALPSVPFADGDAPTLAVACRLLSQQYLHRHIREQGGAYGAQASYRAQTASVVLAAYRDPRLAATIQDMRQGLRWLADCPFDERLLKESQLSIIAGIDAPSSPSGEARNRFLGDLCGVGPEAIDRFRQGVLTTTIERIRAVASTHLDGDRGRLAAITNLELAQRECGTWDQQAL